MLSNMDLSAGLAERVSGDEMSFRLDDTPS